jgi:hypothetical protein
VLCSAFDAVTLLTQRTQLSSYNTLESYGKNPTAMITEGFRSKPVALQFAAQSIMSTLAKQLSAMLSAPSFWQEQCNARGIESTACQVTAWLTPPTHHEQQPVVLQLP